MIPENTSALIDVDAILKKKMGDKWLPGPMISLVKRFLHQDDFNAYFSKGEVGYEFLFGLFDSLGYKVEVTGEENIPAEGRFTFVSNHPLGMLDAGFMTGWLARRYQEQIAVPANDFMMSIPQIRGYLLPVNKVGQQSRELGELLMEAFHSNKQLLIFPAGLCSRKIDGVVTDLPWKKTFLTKSRATRRDIIPIWFSGQNSKRFYRISDWCKRLRLKTNFAMLTLPDELFKARGGHYRMIIGKPIPYETFTKEKTDQEWIAYVREKVYALSGA